MSSPNSHAELNRPPVRRNTAPPSRPPAGPGQWLARAILLTVAVLAVLAFVQLIIDRLYPPQGNPGLQTDVTYERPDGMTAPQFTAVTAEVGLEEWRMVGTESMRGGVALADVNGDGLNDLAVAGGSLALYLNSPTGFVEADLPLGGEATSVALGDLDGDGSMDLIAGFRDEPLAVVFDVSSSGQGVMRLGEPTFTTSIALVDLDRDGDRELVQLNYDGPDVVWSARNPVQFVAEELPRSAGRSMAVAVFDATGDGRHNIWVTRDVGWVEGADSVYEQSGDPDDPGWTDIARDIGGAQAIDGMGITVADMNRDGDLDVYLSDLGDNEILMRSGTGFEPRAETGTARIRPAGADLSIISSSWASGVTDINHDGILDLVVVNGGFVNGMVPNKIDGSSIATFDPPSIFLGLGDGTYTDAWSEIAAALPESYTTPGLNSRGLAIGDIDGDRDADLIITDVVSGLIVLRNDTPGPVSLITGANCAGVELELRGSTSEVVLLGATSFLGHHAPEISIGAIGPIEVQPGGPVDKNATLALPAGCDGLG